MQVKNAAGDFLRTDGTFGAAQDLQPRLPVSGRRAQPSSTTPGLLPVGDYQVIATATDGVGNATVKTTDVKVTDVLETKTPLLTSYTGFTALRQATTRMGYTFKVGAARRSSAPVGMFDTDKDGVYDNTSRHSVRHLA